MPSKTALPRRAGVRSGRPRAMSKMRNQTATTVAPIKPAMTPSRRTGRSSGIVERMVAPAPGPDKRGGRSAAGPHEAEAVVGVATLRGQRGAVGDRAPRVRVAPGAAARDAAPAAFGPGRVPRRRTPVVVVAVPVEAPLVADAGEIGQAERVWRRGGDPRRAIEPLDRPRVAPREARVLEAAARRLLPLGLGGEPVGAPAPPAVQDRVVPGDADDRLVRIGEARVGPERRTGGARQAEVLGVLGPGDGRARDP